MRQNELIRKADLALSDLTTNGGYLQPSTSNRFIRKIIDTPRMLRDVRTVPMARPQMELNKIGFGSRVLRAARNSSTQRSGPYPIGQRALTESERASPTTSKISLQTSEVLAEIDLPYEVLEDNIEGDNLRDTILTLLADRVSLDLEELIIRGDTDSVDPYLALQDGVLVSADANVVNHGGDPMNVDLFKNMAKAVPTQYLDFMDQMKIYLAPYREIDYRATVAQRQTALGDAIISGKVAPTILGVPIARAAKMPVDQAIMTIPSNLILGIQRRIQLEFAKDVRERVYIIVLSMRIALGIEDEDLVVKATNIGDEV